jgi:ubiquitin thioesterase OTU1
MDTRCIVVYSGIHYDRIAFAMDLGYPPDFDTTQWPTEDDQVLQKASELAQKLREQHYFTDTTDFIITCQVCGWVGEGTKGAATHIKETGHSEFVETKIS